MFYVLYDINFIFINQIKRRDLSSQIIEYKDSYFYYEAILHNINNVLSLFLVTIKKCCTSYKHVFNRFNRAKQNKGTIAASMPGTSCHNGGVRKSQG